MKVVVAAFNQEKALVGAFSVIVQPVVEPMDRFAALVIISSVQQPGLGLVSAQDVFITLVTTGNISHRSRPARGAAAGPTDKT